jgi:hypothetical protein
MDNTGIQPKAAREISEVVKITATAAARNEPNAMGVYPHVKRLLDNYLAIITAPNQGNDYLEHDADKPLEEAEVRELARLLASWYGQLFRRHHACLARY